MTSAHPVHPDPHATRNCEQSKGGGRKGDRRMNVLLARDWNKVDLDG